MELSEPTLRHYLNLCQHRRALLEGVSLVAFRHKSHLMSAMSRLGLDVLNDEQSLKRVLDLIFEDQGNPSGTHSRPMVAFINVMPCEMYLCLLYVELEGYRTASNRDPSLAFRPLDELLVQKAAAVENLKTMRDKVLHPAKRIDLGDAHAGFLDSARLVDGHHYQTVSDLQRRLDMYVLWLGTSLIKHGIDEVTAVAKSGREIEPARLDLLQRARVAFNAPPPFFDNAYDPTARQTPFDVQHWATLGLYQEVRLDAPSGPHPDFLRRTKTDAMRTLMRSLVFANECMHLIDPEKLRSFKTHDELVAHDPAELLLGRPPATDQEIQNLFAPWRMSCALLAEPLRLYHQTVELMPSLRRQAIDEAIGPGGVPAEMARFRNLVFHLGGTGDNPSDTENRFLTQFDGGTLPLRLLPPLLGFFMSV